MKWWLWLLVAGIKEIKAYKLFLMMRKKILIGTQKQNEMKLYLENLKKYNSQLFPESFSTFAT